MRTFRKKADGGPIQETMNVGTSNWQLECVRLHLDSPGTTGSFTITVDSENGGWFDFLLFTQDMMGVSDVVWLPEMAIPLTKSDNLVFTYENANDRAYGLEIFWGLK